MKRKYGFTLVELLIVLAVIAALIATITPLALNAVRKARASQVAQNMRTLASGFENAVLIDSEAPTDINNIGRDIPSADYGIAYAASGGEWTVTVYTKAQADLEAVKEILPAITDSASVTTDAASGTLGGLGTDNAEMFYNFMFRLY